MRDLFGDKCNRHDSLKGIRAVLFALFFLSGFAGLLYQVVWLRMAYASFGIITPVLSVVISVFMLGLAAGSIFGGRIIEALSAMTGLSPVLFYALAECCIGVGAFIVPQMFRWGAGTLLMKGGMDSAAYLACSALVITVSILPWCVFMGFTFPFMMSFVKALDKSDKTGFSFLYLANVIGAMSGTVITALVLVELLGLRKTWTVAAYVNFLIAAISVAIAMAYPYKKNHAPKIADDIDRDIAPDTTISPRQTLLLLLTTGFTSMSLEVIWIRAFTPAFGTSIYTFAAILAVYLLATSAGSFLYRRHLARGGVYDTFKLIRLLGISVFLPVVLSDWRLRSLDIVFQSLILFSIMPFCALLGYLTPKLIDFYSQGRPSGAGYAYCINIIGCIAGPILASYVFLQYLGIKLSMVAMALPFVVFYMSYLLRPAYRAAMSKWPTAVVAALLIISTFVSYDHEMFYNKDGNSVARDYTATVVATGKGMDKQLFVNGIGITNLTPITKYMAHIPMIFLDRARFQAGEPVSALIICLGMGTTHRSMLSWNIKSTAVELIPSVRTVFPYFFDDAHAVLENPNGRIVIDDGRRFLNRTADKYDVITIDPPPPVEAAGSSLLYSEDFYAVIKSRLREGGIFQQWVPVAEGKIQQAVARSIFNSFPYVRAFTGIEGWGVHFISSVTPIKTPDIEEIEAIMPDVAKKDLLEWSTGKDLGLVLRNFLSKEQSAQTLLNTNKYILINDDKPYNEYYFLRRLKASLMSMRS
ncbi:fused MFS/spermidine synthase [Candidatus Magnetominusculus dajiuhuensis]|uniref:fused MFS/spermidine synthase n=1 Tax=Candidatus Magnetominusculus dajiuhuensis TaxID=3137712 RepID=UPI003B4307DB